MIPLSRTKLGPHCLRPTQDAKSLVAAGCRIAKLVDEFGLAAEYLALNPDLLIIGRVFTTTTAESQRWMAPKAAARKFVDSQRAKYEANPLIKLWEGHNEPVWGDPKGTGPADMSWYAAFEVERARILFEEMGGLRAVIGNFSTGTPHLDDDGTQSMWGPFEDALHAIVQFGGLLGIHEYSSPWMWALFGRHQKLPNVDGGPQGWTTFRYRKVKNKVLEPMGLLGKVQFAITEYGLDTIQGNARPEWAKGNGKFKQVTGFWNEHDGQGDEIDYWRGPERDADKYYAHQLIWADQLLQEDDDVAGATIFTLGSSNPIWNDCDINGTRATPVLVSYMKKTAGQGRPLRLPAPGGPQPGTPPPASTKFEMRDKAVVTPGGKLNVRATAGGEDIDDLFTGDTVEIVGGPRRAAVDGTEYVWWFIKALKDGKVITGWCIEPRLALVPNVPAPDPDPEPDPEPEPPPMPPTNLYPNPTFADGWHHQDGVTELAVPNGSRVHFFDDMRVLPGETQPVRTARPETTVWPWQDAPEHEREQFFGPRLPDGSYTYPFIVKEFKPWMAMYAGLGAEGLVVPAGEWEWSIEVFPDHKKKGGDYVDKPETRSHDYLRHAHYRMFANGAFGPWLNGLSVPCGRWTTLTTPFSVSRQATMDVAVEVTALFGLDNNCVFYRNPRLIQKAPAPVPSPDDDFQQGLVRWRQALDSISIVLADTALSLQEATHKVNELNEALRRAQEVSK